MFASVIVIHEWGHYITAKKCGVLVHEFAIGMGPVLWSQKKGETVYSIRLLPIGGFCSMEEEVGEGNNPRAMASKKPWQKLLIVSAGAIMNFILGIFLLSFIAGYQGYSSNIIASLEKNMPAAEAGLQVGDQIIRINNTEVKRLDDLTKVLKNQSETYILKIKRDNITMNIEIASKWMEDEGRARFGFSTELVRFNIVESIKEGIHQVTEIVTESVKIIVKICTGQGGTENVGSIVSVVDQSAKLWDKGMEVGGVKLALLFMINVAGVISVSIGLMNLLPLPALDGGRIVFVLIEMLRGKPVPPEKEGAVHFVGFVLLMILSVVLIYNDFMRISL